MALSDQQFNQFLLDAEDSTGFGMKRYDELKALGATDKQIAEIAARAPIVGDAVAGMFSELTSWGAGEKANLSRVPPGFNWIEYVKSNPDLRAAGIDTGEEAKRHYALTGYQEGRPNAPALLVGITDKMWKQAERDPYYAAQLHDPNLLNLLKNNPDEALKLRQQDRANRVGAIYSELENQYNNLVSAGQQQGKNLAYSGRSGDLPAIFNQQAQQLADAGVTSISNLRIQDGKLVDSAINKTVTNSNLGGQVAVDRDTGVQKWGDIFSGVEGGANYGLQELPDGSVMFFPAWEKTKSPIAQIGLGGLEDVIGPALTIAGAYYGMPGLGEVGGAAAGAAAGNSVGQYLASGDIDWGQVALSAAVAGGTQAALGGAEAAGAPTPDGGIVGTPGVSTVYPVAPPNIGVATLPPQAAAGGGLLAAQAGAPISTATPVPANELAFPAREVAYTPNASLDPNSFQAALPGMGVSTAATTAPFTAAPGSLAAAGGLTGAAALAAEGGGLLGAASVGDALKMAAVGSALFGQQPQMGGLLGGQRGGGQPMGVDYSGLLALLQARPTTPNVAPLLAPAVNRYQPLTTQQSLLG